MTVKKTKKLSVYLAHPYAEKDYGMTVMAKLEALGITVVNPFIRGEQEVYDKVIKSKGSFDDKMCKDIVENDLEKVREVDAVVALVLPVKSIGTFMEIFYCAYVLKKPVLSLYGLVSANDGKSGWAFIHPWIKYLTEPALDEEQLFANVKTWKEVTEARRA